MTLVIIKPSVLECPPRSQEKEQGLFFALHVLHLFTYTTQGSGAGSQTRPAKDSEGLSGSVGIHFGLIRSCPAPPAVVPGVCAGEMPLKQCLSWNLATPAFFMPLVLSQPISFDGTCLLAVTAVVEPRVWRSV